MAPALRFDRRRAARDLGGGTFLQRLEDSFAAGMKVVRRGRAPPACVCGSFDRVVRQRWARGAQVVHSVVGTWPHSGSGGSVIETPRGERSSAVLGRRIFTLVGRFEFGDDDSQPRGHAIARDVYLLDRHAAFDGDRLRRDGA